MPKHKCPVCGKTEFENKGSYDICENCGWEDDWYQEENPDEDVGANEYSLNVYKDKYDSVWRPDWLKKML
ncbi:MAG: hypothetical protein LUC95_02250 [Lachnospiraceae bacterium]|nr:hypothetical protein [Lachnospiraceae bacterium]